MLNLEKLECLPTKETHRSNFIKSDYYGDNFKKSANEFYGRGYNYARAVVRKHFNKPVKGLVYKLRNQTKCKHRSFKMAIEEVIKTDLLTDSNWNYLAYVDDQGIVRDIEDYPYKREPYKYNLKPETIDTIKFYEFDGKYIMRIKGIHYFVTQSYFVYEKFKTRYSYDSKNFYYFCNIYKVDTNYDSYRVQLSSDQLKKYELVNVWE